MAITRLAPAKINLMLHVVGRLPDGYHHLQSLVSFASVGDQVTFEQADAFRLTVGGPFAQHVPLVSDNSVAVAARWFEERFKGIGRAHIHLTKNLPVASGIGGGSSDAAATLAVLLQGFGAFLSRADEEALILASGELGADVPICLAHQLGWGSLLWIDSSGRETLPVPVDVSLSGAMPGWVVLVNPGFSVSTPAVFKKVCPPYTLSQGSVPLLEGAFQKRLLPWLKGQKNDLMEPAIALEPKIGAIMEYLQKIPECRLARMSGSGATCFALFEDRDGAHKASLACGRAVPQGWIAVGQPIGAQVDMCKAAKAWEWPPICACM